MKTNLKVTLISLFFLMSLIVSVNALSHELDPIHPGVIRNWRLSEQTTQIDTTRAWENHNLTHNYYGSDTTCCVDSTVYCYYDAAMGWVPADKDCFCYDDSGQHVTQILHKLIFMGEPWTYMRSVFTYNTEGHITTATAQMSGGIDRDWIDTKRTYISYLNDGTLDKIISWEAGLIYRDLQYTKSEFTFDAQGRILTQVESTSEDSVNWMYTFQSNFTYHSGDTTTGASLVELISKTLPLSFYRDLPIQIGMLSERITLIWLYSYWGADTKDTYTYDNSNRIVSHNTYYWPMGGYWANDTLTTYSYDANFNLSSELLQLWNEVTNEWNNYLLTSNTWEQMTANDDDTNPVITDLTLSIYPNPFAESFQIETRSKSLAPVKLELYNTKGQKVFQSTVSPNAKSSFDSKSFANKHLGAGIYFFKAKQGTASTCKKIIRLN